MLLSGLVVSLVSYWMKKTVVIPITFLVMGVYLVWWSFSVVRGGIAYYCFMAGSIFIITGLVTTVFVVASSYAKRP